MENVRLTRDQKVGVRSGFLLVGIMYILYAIPFIITAVLFAIGGATLLKQVSKSASLGGGIIPAVVLAVIGIICLWRAIHFLGWRKKIDDPEVEQKIIKKCCTNYHFVLNLILSIFFWNVGIIPTIIIRVVCVPQIANAINDMVNQSMQQPINQQPNEQPIEEEVVYTPEKQEQTAKQNIKLNLKK